MLNKPLTPIGFASCSNGSMVFVNANGCKSTFNLPEFMRLDPDYTFDKKPVYFLGHGHDFLIVVFGDALSPGWMTIGFDDTAFIQGLICKLAGEV